MNKNKYILKHCPNFYKIINFEYEESDKLTEKLINIYHEYIFNINELNQDDLKTIEQLDYVLNKYIEDYFFRKSMRNCLMEIKINKNESLFKSVIEGIIEAYENYETGYTRNIYFARWI